MSKLSLREQDRFIDIVKVVISVSVFEKTIKDEKLSEIFGIDIAPGKKVPVKVVKKRK